MSGSETSLAAALWRLIDESRSTGQRFTKRDVMRRLKEENPDLYSGNLYQLADEGLSARLGAMIKKPMLNRSGNSTLQLPLALGGLQVGEMIVLPAVGLSLAQAEQQQEFECKNLRDATFEELRLCLQCLATWIERDRKRFEHLRLLYIFLKPHMDGERVNQPIGPVLAAIAEAEQSELAALSLEAEGLL